jgi:rhamnosyltransferase
MNPETAKIVAVVVTFNPFVPDLERLLFWLRSRVFGIVLVDNGSLDQKFVLNLERTINKPNFFALMQSENLGIAVAQNIGVAKAQVIEASHVVFFDQDSEPINEMLETLMRALIFLERQGVIVGCVGPNYVDSRQNNQPPFISVEGLKLIRHRCSDCVNIVPVDYLISSGSLIPLSSIKAVGGMREDLFIDYVDIEWGLRAKLLGYRSFGVCDAKMKHQLGDEPVILFNRKVPVHSPLRHYYHFRNAILLYFDPKLPLNWKLVDCYRLLLKFVAYSLVAKPRLAHFGMMSKGIIDGFRRIGGRYRT